MRILVDADSMPVRVREIIVRHAVRRKIEALFVSNHPIPVPEASGIGTEIVDDADERIAELAGVTDLVVTHDIPLAARVVERGAVVITERGERYSQENVRTRLSSRNFAMDMREAGLLEQRGHPFGKKDIQAFANALDRELANRDNGRQG